VKSLKIFISVLLFFVLTAPLLSQEYLICVDFSERHLYLINGDGLVIKQYLVAIPYFVPNYLPAYGEVIAIEKNPYWYPTEKTRKHYLEKYGVELPRAVKPDDPLNAMGIAVIVIKFDSLDVNPLIRIHGTNDPDSIGKKITSGCIRLHNQDILDLIAIIEKSHTRVIFQK